MVSDNDEDNETTAWYRRPFVWIVVGAICILITPCTIAVLVYLLLATYVESLAR